MHVCVCVCGRGRDHLTDYNCKHWWSTIYVCVCIEVSYLDGGVRAKGNAETEGFWFGELAKERAEFGKRGSSEVGGRNGVASVAEHFQHRPSALEVPNAVHAASSATDLHLHYAFASPFSHRHCALLFRYVTERGREGGREGIWKWRKTIQWVCVTVWVTQRILRASNIGTE